MMEEIRCCTSATLRHIQKTAFLMRTSWLSRLGETNAWERKKCERGNFPRSTLLWVEESWIWDLPTGWSRLSLSSCISEASLIIVGWVSILIGNLISVSGAGFRPSGVLLGTSANIVLWPYRGNCRVPGTRV
jgi:hypothetical protein